MKSYNFLFMKFKNFANLKKNLAGRSTVGLQKKIFLNNILKN